MGFTHDRYGVPNSEPELDTTPVEMPLGSVRPTPLHELIARMVRDTIVQETQEDFDTFEDADDFEEEDPDTLDFSAYELTQSNEEMTIADWEEADAQGEDPTPHPDDLPQTGDQADPDPEETG